MKATPETYVRAETDRQFGIVARMAGGVNRIFHLRHLTPLDKQNIVRMNRDTLYSMAVVDTSKGATISVPAIPEGRYASVYLVDNDHYCPFVIYDSGTHELPRDTRYLGVGVRIQVFDPRDADEIALLNGLQDQRVELPDADLSAGSIRTGGRLQAPCRPAREVNDPRGISRRLRGEPRRSLRVVEPERLSAS